MAYMSQEHKARIATELKKVMPKDWKYSLSVKHYSTIILRITSAPIDLFNLHKQHENWSDGYIQLNEYHFEHAYDGQLLETFKKIRRALNLDNYDRSDSQTDYFDVGHYVAIHIGRWDKPFQVISSTPEPTYDELKARIAALEAKNH